MKIGLISDTHGDLDAFNRAYDIIKECDIIMHSGDLFYHGLFNLIKETYNPLELSKLINGIKKPIIYSRGNCDSEVDQLAVDFDILDPVRIFYYNDENIIYLHHGHKKKDEELIDLSRKFKFNIVVSGHTHIYRIEKKGNVIFINPGSPSLPKGGNPPTIGEIDFDNNEINITNINDRKKLITSNIF
ncbi:MAG: phosphodiesterase [Actinobacteria bacterium]|nr:phosphodiesterase [Actinomycetota bacterium]